MKKILAFAFLSCLSVQSAFAREAQVEIYGTSAQLMFNALNLKAIVRTSVEGLQRSLVKSGNGFECEHDLMLNVFDCAFQANSRVVEGTGARKMDIIGTSQDELSVGLGMRLWDTLTTESVKTLNEVRAVEWQKHVGQFTVSKLILRNLETGEALQTSYLLSYIFN